jgi:hypothetical protein
VGQTRQTRAEYLRGYNKVGRQHRRAKLVDMLGGRCVRCGAIEDLEFDHIDPTTKRFAVGSSMSRAWDVLVEEALKCQLLCRSCHREKAVEDRPEPAHSYYRYWYYGCRCGVCRAANAAKSARLRQRKAWGRRSSPHANQTPASMFAPALGLEPRTCRLTAGRSAD